MILTLDIASGEFGGPLQRLSLLFIAILVLSAIYFRYLSLWFMEALFKVSYPLDPRITALSRSFQDRSIGLWGWVHRHPP